MKHLLAFPLLGLLASGCAHVNPRPAFSDVEKKVKERTGHSLSWARNASETEAIEQRVAKLLEEEITVDTAVRVALLNNRSLQAKLEEIGISHADLVQAGLLSNPDFGGFARFPHSPPNGPNIELFVIKDFLDLLVRPLRKKVAATQLEQTKALVAHEILALVADVKSAYYTLQGRLQLIKRLRLIQEINEAAADQANRQHEAGTMSDLDLAQNQAVYNQSRVDVALAEVEARADRERLNRLLGLWGADTAWRIDDQLPDLPEQEVSVERLESLAMEQRFDLGAARWGVDVVGYAVALKKRTRYFPVGVNIGVETEKDSDRHRVTGPSLTVQLPVFDRGQASLARLESQLFQSQRQLEALAINARSDVREARDFMLAARDLARYYREILLPQRVQILDLTQRQYNMMLKGVYDLLLAKQNEVATERAYVEAWRNYWIARAQLERAVGGKLPVGGESAAQANDKGGGQ